MEIWALNLPQFYEVPENNEWWGEGFTEWTNVKKAKPLYKGHCQPSIPLNNNYYDLSEKKTIKWQFELAKAYGITGFVYFHYWYSGRKILEKPCEVLLNSPEIDGRYCFCWANHSWTRAWDAKDHEMLLEQTYGDVTEWESHFQYLLPFFKDSRYIKIDNKPVLFLYKAKQLQDGDKRIAYWEQRLQEEGIPGIYIVEYLNTFNTTPSLECSQAVFEDEPNFTCRFKISFIGKIKRVVCKIMKMTDYQNFDKLWKIILKKRNTYKGKKIFYGCFPCWDNSPRRGKNSRVIRGATPEKFSKYFAKLLDIKRKDSAGIIVVNAWNEWGEGAMLEPTEQYGYKYLEAIKDSLENMNVEI